MKKLGLLGFCLILSGAAAWGKSPTREFRAVGEASVVGSASYLLEQDAEDETRYVGKRGTVIQDQKIIQETKAKALLAARGAAVQNAYAKCERAKFACQEIFSRNLRIQRSGVEMSAAPVDGGEAMQVDKKIRIVARVVVVVAGTPSGAPPSTLPKRMKTVKRIISLPSEVK